MHICKGSAHPYLPIALFWMPTQWTPSGRDLVVCEETQVQIEDEDQNTMDYTQYWVLMVLVGMSY